MKTNLPSAINTIEEAETFLRVLHENGEAFHPDDNAHDIVWCTSAPSRKELEQLNKLMSDISRLKDFDEYEFLLNL